MICSSVCPFFGILPPSAFVQGTTSECRTQPPSCLIFGVWVNFRVLGHNDLAGLHSALISISYQLSISFSREAYGRHSCAAHQPSLFRGTGSSPAQSPCELQPDPSIRSSPRQSDSFRPHPFA